MYSLDGEEASGVGVTYWMNRLQPLATPSDWCVTLNRSSWIDPSKVAFRTSLAHPRLDAPAVAAQARWEEIDGTGGVHYAGAYWRWGFHEDGMWSGVRAAEAVLAAAEEAAA
jgi:predicted NAD/FAD-binding protein